MSLDGTQIAAVSYDTLGRQSGYTYGNGTTGTNGFDSFQRQVGLSFALGGTSITSDAVTRDARTAMIVDQSVDGVDANLLGANFGYDRSGRLVNWWQRDPGSGNKYQGAYRVDSSITAALRGSLPHVEISALGVGWGWFCSTPVLGSYR